MTTTRARRTTGASGRDAVRLRELGEMSARIGSSASVAQGFADGHLRELRRREADVPDDGGVAAEHWLPRCMNQALRYFDAVEQADSLRDELHDTRTMIAAIDPAAVLSA